MVTGKTSTYKHLTARRQHASNMKVVLACLFGILVLTGITGHLFIRRDTTAPSPPPPQPHQEVLAKLIKTSEDAIGWIGNKTIDSINNIKNLTTAAVTPESPLVVKENRFLKWLREVSHYNSTAVTVESTETEVPEDSGESVVIAHRTPGQGFSWGPLKKNKSDGDQDTGSPGLLHAAGRRVHNVLSYLYQTSRNITQRGKDILQSGIDKVKTTKESLRTKLLKMGEKRNDLSPGGSPATDVDVPCEDVADNVCAVDWGRKTFTIFPNSCWARVYNQQHGTSFSIHDSDVCIDLFAKNPENYQKIDNPGL